MVYDAAEGGGLELGVLLMMVGMLLRKNPTPMLRDSIKCWNRRTNHCILGLFDVFCKTRKTSQGWTDSKSTRIGEAVEKEISDSNEDLSQQDIDEIFVKNNQPSKKKCIYGTGSAGVHYAKASSQRSRSSGGSITSSQTFQMEVDLAVDSRLERIKQQQQEELIHIRRQQEEQQQEQLKKNEEMERKNQEMQAQLAALTTLLQQQGMTLPTPPKG